MINPIFLTDSYKLSHINFQVDGVSEIYSNGTPRFLKYFKALYPNSDDKIIAFGIQYVIKRIFIDAWENGFFNRPKEEVIQEAKRVLVPYIAMENLKHFEDLHDLGYLPLEFKSIPEGTAITVGIPLFTIRNTIPKFEWLPNYLESIISTELWKMLTVANVGRQFRLLSNQYALMTTGSIAGTEFQNHDFSLRGQSGWESSAAIGVGFLLSSWGTDNVPAVWAAEKYYNANIEKEPIAFSVPAGEHSVTTLGITVCGGTDRQKGEKEYLSWLMKNRFPQGILSYVADSYDYWYLISNILPELKSEIMSREGKLVIRGDSGDPVKIIAGYIVTDLTEFVTIKDLFKSPISNNRFDVIKLGDGKYYRDDSGVDSSGEFVKAYTELTEAEVKGTIETLWDIFGGSVNDQGFKVLDDHIGMIYGDGITMERAKEIFDRLVAKGFSTLNIVFGIGLI